MNYGQPITIVPSGYMGMPNKSIGVTDGGQAILASDSTYELCYKFIVATEKLQDEKESRGHQPAKDEGGIREGKVEGGRGHQEPDAGTQVVVSGTGDAAGVADNHRKKKNKQRRPADV